jgi:hypothetical protein
MENRDGIEVAVPDVDTSSNPNPEANRPNTEGQQQANESPQLAKKSKRSGAERSTDTPSWAKGSKPKPGESGKDFAERVFREHGKPLPGTKDRGPGSDFSKIKKYGDRNK